MSPKRELFWAMIKPGQNWSIWGNKSFSDEQEAVDYLKANICYPVSDIEFRLVETIANYGMQFEIVKRSDNVR